MIREIYLVDTETTGLDGAVSDDQVVEIAISKVDLYWSTVTPIYDAIVGHDTNKWTDAHRSAWVFSHTSLKIEDLKLAKPQPQIRDEVAKILAGKCVTSWNIDFDFYRFLFLPPWNFRRLFMLVDDPMVAARSIVGRGRLEAVYDELCPEDPAGIHGAQAHRAGSDTVVAGYAMLALSCRGYLPGVIV